MQQENEAYDPEAMPTEEPILDSTAEPKPAPKAERKHRATYARDNRNGGYLIRVQGPTAEKFAGREVPVTLRSGKEHNETLERLIWKGADQVSGQPVALYAFKAKPRDEQQEIAF